VPAHVLYEVMHNAPLAPPMTFGDGGKMIPVENPEQYKPEEQLRRVIGIFPTHAEAEHWAISLGVAAERAGKSDFWDFPVEEVEEGELSKIEILEQEFANMTRGD